MKFPNRPSLVLPLLLCAAACGTPVALDQSGSEPLTQQLSPQSFTHGLALAAAPVRYFIAGRAGDDLQPDVWPTRAAGNALVPTLALFGPPDASGARPLLATGEPGDTPGHIAIELQLPQSGLYLIEVGAEPEHEGSFTFRLWTSASRAPRPEAMQVSLDLLPSDALDAALYAHAMAEDAPWTNAELDPIAAAVQAETDPQVAISDLALLYETLATARAAGLATDAIVERAEQLAASFIGTPAQFTARPASVQTLALYWLGAFQPAAFASAPISSPAPAQAAAVASIDRRIEDLVASWSGSVEETSVRTITAFTRNGALYGYQANWQAVQLDEDGLTQVFTWSSIDDFSPGGAWIGESSEGALLPDD